MDELGGAEGEGLRGFIPRHLRDWIHPSEHRLSGEDAHEAGPWPGLVEGPEA